MTNDTLKIDAPRVNGSLDADSPAFHKLCRAKWAVSIPRSIATNNTFGAVAAWSAACAWRDRGRGMGNGTRPWSARPPGGWPALVGVTAETWRRWRAQAVAAKLITVGPGKFIRPVAAIAPGEQFARVEIAVLFNRNLSQRARRTFVALSLFRQRSGLVSASVGKIGEDAGLGKRHVRRALRELESVGVLQFLGRTAGGIRRYLVIQSAFKNDDFGHPKNDDFGPPIKNVVQESYQDLSHGPQAALGPLAARNKSGSPPDVRKLNGKGKEKKKGKGTNVDQAKKIYEFLNSVTGRKFKVFNRSGGLTLGARYVITLLGKGYEYRDFEFVIPHKFREWTSHDQMDRMEKFIRPTTLFRLCNFEGYAGERDAEPEVEPKSSQQAADVRATTTPPATPVATPESRKAAAVTNGEGPGTEMDRARCGTVRESL